MMKRLQSRWVVWLVPGIILGGLVGLNLRSFLPSVPLHASATQGFDNFAIATGLIDNRIEGLFFLDYVTGQLKCAVINPKTGKFNAAFARDVASDFGGASQGEAKYLMVTGLADMARGRANFQIGRCRRFFFQLIPLDDHTISTCQIPPVKQFTRKGERQLITMTDGS